VTIFVDLPIILPTSINHFYREGENVIIEIITCQPKVEYV
jgi:hypothetical protein